MAAEAERSSHVPKVRIFVGWQSRSTTEYGSEGALMVYRIVYLIFVSAGVLYSTQSLASPGSTDGGSPAHLQFGIEAVTDFPLQTGVGASIEWPHRIQLTTSIGRMPRMYLETINDVSLAAGWYGESTANLITSALDNAFVWRTRLGWRPWPESSFYCATGLTRARLDGGLGDTDAAIAVTGASAESGEQSAAGLEIDTTMYMLDTEFGWRFFVWERLAVRVAIGAAFTVSSDSVVRANWTPRPRGEAATRRLESGSEAYLNDTIETYVHTVTATTGLGWFF